MYEAVIGLEVHAQLKTKTKMFCNSKNDPDETRPNVNVCPVCLGHPGTLPTINKKAVEYVVKVGHALSSNITLETKFDRKNYFYPDIPKGYQISQYDLPICAGGHLDVSTRKVNITRVHLEEDTAKSIHKGDYSLVDFNRASAPLMELVTEPDIRTGEEAKEFCEGLQKILQFLNVSDANMEKGQMRCEVNISLKKKDAKEYGTKVEVKNLNSFKAVKDAIEFETKRQEEVLERGEEVVQETRGWDENRRITFSQRKKESAHDYRYFPEPDLPAMHLGKTAKVPKDQIIDIEHIKELMPELPKEMAQRFMSFYGVPESDAKILTSEKDHAFYFENVASELMEFQKEAGKESLSDDTKALVKLAVNYLNSDMKNVLAVVGHGILETKITEKNFAELMFLIFQKKITSAAAKTILAEMAETGADPHHIMEEQGLTQITDAKEIEPIAKEVIEKNPKPVEDYKKGNQNSIQFLLGQVMAKTKGRANPALAKEVLEKLLK